MSRPPPKSTRTDTLFPDPPLCRSRGAIAVIEVAQGERRIGVEQVANAEGRLQRIRDLPAQAVVVRDVRIHVRIVVRRDIRAVAHAWRQVVLVTRSEEHTSELQSLMRISYAVFCLKKKKETIQ